MSSRIYWCVYSKQGCPFEDTVRSLRRDSVEAFMEPLKDDPDESWPMRRTRDGCTVKKVRLIRHPACLTRPQTVSHGLDCPKATHDGTGHLHAEGDDSPYTVDGVEYCGRCHHFLDRGETR